MKQKHCQYIRKWELSTSKICTLQAHFQVKIEEPTSQKLRNFLIRFLHRTSHASGRNLPDAGSGGHVDPNKGKPLPLPTIIGKSSIAGYNDTGFQVHGDLTAGARCVSRILELCDLTLSVDCSDFMCDAPLDCSEGCLLYFATPHFGTRTVSNSEGSDMHT